MSQALYRKYRSHTLNDVVGQPHVTEVLRRSLAAGRISHAYLLTGPKGVGKTSIARILAHEINKLPYDGDDTHLDIIEIDAASNNGVEDVRDLREKVQIAPVSAAKKIYIIDEVHMLSKAAFNALLKTLEEPPEHAVFILATTDVDKLPATIISRTQQFSLHAISFENIKKHLAFIAKQEGITIADDALDIIARRGDGTFRDSINLLDQLASLADDKQGITKQSVELALGLAPTDHVAKLLTAYENRDLAAIVALVDEGEQSGIQVAVLVQQLVQAIRQVIVTKPQLLPLLDLLLDVPKSPQPTVKLLTVLADHAIPKPKTAALSAPVAEVSAPVDALIAKPTPRIENVPTPKKEASNPVPAKAAIRAENKSTKSNSGGTQTDQPQPEMPSGEAHLENLDWNAVIEYAHEHYVAIYSVLSKCSHAVDGDQLIIYTMNNFYKKKLDDAKYRISLATALAETGAGVPIIETIGTPPPPKDSTAAAVAAIMGGGEEVAVDEAA